MTQIQTQDTSMAQAVEAALATGNLDGLTTEQRINYYNSVCKSMGLNPLTRPFEYIPLNGKLTLYCRRDATDQLRKINNVSVAIAKSERLDDVYVVTATATMGGRQDTATGAVALVKEDGTWETASSGKRFFKTNGKYLPLHGDDLANALMKAETKAKRRVTLSIVGLGWLDETEVETVPNAVPFTEHNGNGHEPVATIEPSKPEHWIKQEGPRKYFWGKAKELGFANQRQVHAALRLEHMEEWAGTVEEAVDALQAFLDDAKARVP